MKTLQYIQYFFYLAINWGWKVAWIIIRQDIKGEKRYGINTSGADELQALKKKGVDISHATIYMPVSYTLIEKTLAVLPEKKRNHFLDIGCGKGRALCVAAHAGFSKVSGIDFSPAFCEQAVNNLALIRQQLPDIDYTVSVQEASTYKIPDDVDCIFLFNPFDELIMEKVANNIHQSVIDNSREINIIYANPLYKQQFISRQFTETYYYKTLDQFEISILNRRR